jgi:beta-N-acetylhexosaminidase
MPESIKSLRNSVLDDAGRLLMIGWEGNEASEPISLIEKYRPAGLVFFKRNYPGSHDSLKELLYTIKTNALKILGRPILLALDHEGGTVNRLPLEETALPSHRALSEMAKTSGFDKVIELSYKVAVSLKNLGLNFNLAPVLDLQGQKAYIGERSFSSFSEETKEVAKAFFEGHRLAGLLTCGKHFPGLGSSISDPHKDLPVVVRSVKELWEEDGLPYRELINLGLEAVMTTHALFRGVDPILPATFSEKVVTLLKEDYAFKGLVLTDDLEMGALDGIFSKGESAVQSIQAGHDLALICRHEENILSASEALQKAILDGALSQKRLRQALLRLGKVLKTLE